jgi:hypothetical protein
MKQMLIGSRAIRITKQLELTPFEGFWKRIENSDYDWAIQEGEYYSEEIDGVRHEHHPMPEVFAFQAHSINDILLTIKLSHCIYDIAFDKTMKDIAMLQWL